MRSNQDDYHVLCASRTLSRTTRSVLSLGSTSAFLSHLSPRLTDPRLTDPPMTSVDIRCSIKPRPSCPELIRVNMILTRRTDPASTALERLNHLRVAEAVLHLSQPRSPHGSVGLLSSLSPVPPMAQWAFSPVSDPVPPMVEWAFSPVSDPVCDARLDC